MNRPVDPAQPLSLNCVLLPVDEKSNLYFTVKILKTENVSILKRLIKEKLSPCLNHVDAAELILSQVSLPEDNLEESLKNVKNVDLAQLDPLLRLSDVFPRVEEKRLHVIVRAPTDSKPTSAFLHLTENQPTASSIDH